MSLPKHLSLSLSPEAPSGQHFSLSLLSLRVLFSLNLSLSSSSGHTPTSLHPIELQLSMANLGARGGWGARMLELGGGSELGRRSYTSSGAAAWLLELDGGGTGARAWGRQWAGCRPKPKLFLFPSASFHSSGRQAPPTSAGRRGRGRNRRQEESGRRFGGEEHRHREHGR